MTGPCLVLASLLAAQAAAVDRAVIVVRERGREIGRESYELREGVLDDRTPGHRLEARGTRTGLAFVYTIQANEAGGAREFNLELTRARGERAILFVGRMSRGVFLVRALAMSGERARELPASSPPTALTDSAFSSYALLPHRLDAGDSTFVVVIPESARRVTARVADRGLERTPVNGVPAMLRRLDLQLGDEQRTVWLCPEDNRFVKLAVPAREIVVERLPAGT